MPSSFQTDPQLRTAVDDLQGQRRRSNTALWIFLLTWIGGFVLVSLIGDFNPWGWVWVASFIVLGLVNMAAQMRALTQMCPRCNSPLTEEHGWWRTLPPACPRCGLVIEQSTRP
jgi:hypothetical protein